MGQPSFSSQFYSKESLKFGWHILQKILQGGKFWLATFALLIQLIPPFTLPAQAAVDRVIPFTARLRLGDANNIVPDATYNVTFSIYGVETGGSPVWSETQSVLVQSGVLRVLLGSTVPFANDLAFNDGNYYLAIKIGNDSEMRPRRRLGAVPVALNAQTVSGSSPGVDAGNVLLLNSSGNIAIPGSASLGGGLTIGGSLIPSVSGQNIGSLTNHFQSVYADSISGRWQGSVVGVQYGGTGLASVNPGDLLYAPSLNTVAGLPVGQNNQCLTVVNSLPVWGSCSGGAGGIFNLQSAYDNGNGTLTAANAKDLAITLPNTATNSNFTVNIATGSTGKFAVQSNGSDVLRITANGASVLVGGINNNNGGLVNVGSLAGGTSASFSGAVSVGSLASTGAVTGSSINAATITGGVLSSSAVNGLAVTAGTISTGVWQGTPIAVLYGGTGSTTASGARTNLGAATAGANSDITSLSGLGTPLSVGQGGTGASSLTAKGVTYGNGSSALQATVAGSSGQLLLASVAGTPTFVSLSGDATLTAAGLLTIGAGAVTSSKIASGTIVAANLQSGDFSTSITSGTYSVNISGNAATVSNGVYTNLANTITAPSAAAIPLTVRPAASGTANVFQIYDKTGALASYFDANGVFKGTGSGLTAASVANSALTNPSLTVATTTGLTGGGSVALGGTITLSNTGLTSVRAGAGATQTGDITLTSGSGINITNSGANFTIANTASGGTVTSVASGSGLTGGPITGAGTLSVDATAIPFLGSINTFSAANTFSSGLTVSAGSVSLPASSVVNAALQNSAVTITTGAGLSGGSAVSLGGSVTISNSGVTALTGGTGITVNQSTGAVQVSIPQSVALAATPTFTGLTLSGASGLTVGVASTTAGKVAFKNATNAFLTNLQSGTPAATDITLSLPNTQGNNGDCLLSDGSGHLSFSSCTGGAGGGVTSLNGLSGVLALNNASGSASSVTINDASTSQKGIASFNSTNFSSSTGVINTIQNINSTASPTFAGLTLGVASTTTGGITLYNGTNANTALLRSGTSGGNLTFTLPISAGGNGQCLQTDGAGNLSFGGCTGGVGGGVTSVDSQTGVVSIGNSTGSGGVITINDASTSQKGIASFSSTNFTTTSGAVNTVQGISTTASPTFAGLTLSSALTLGNGGTGLTTAPTGGQLLVGNGSSAYAVVSLSGDATLVAGGALTIGTGAVTGSKIASATITAANLQSGSYASVITSGTYSIGISGNAATVTNGIYTNAANTIAVTSDVVPLSLKPLATTGTAHVLNIYNNAGTPAISSYFDAAGLFNGSGAGISASSISNSS